jgi:hypothetical protein
MIAKITSVAFMPAFGRFLGSCILLVAGPSFGQQSGPARPCRTGPVAKNVMVLNTPECDAVRPQELGRRQIEKLAQRGKEPEDHLIAARYFKAKADSLESQANGYEQAIVDAHGSLQAKNLSAPGMSARYAYSARLCRENAKMYRARAAKQEQMASQLER